MKGAEYLKTIANYAKMQGVTTTYIYRMVKAKRLSVTEIDGVKFIDISVYPTIKKV